MLLLRSPSPYLMDALSIGQLHPSIFWFSSCLQKQNLLACHHSWNLPPPPLSKGKGGGGGGVGTSKNLKREGVDVEMCVCVWGGVECHFFITLQFNHIYCVWGESKVPFILLFGSSVFSVGHARFSSKSSSY